MSYQYKNCFVRNARYDSWTSVEWLRYFLRGYPAAHAAKILGVPKPTIVRFFEGVRQRLFSDFGFFYSVLDTIEEVRMDGAAFLLNTAWRTEPDRLIGCAFYCGTDTPPKVVHRILVDREIDGDPLMLRMQCLGCPMKLYKFEQSILERRRAVEELRLAAEQRDKMSPEKVQEVSRKEQALQRLEERNQALRRRLEQEGKSVTIRPKKPVNQAAEKHLRDTREMFDRWKVESKPTDAMEHWINVLDYLSRYRRIKDKPENIRMFTLSGVVASAIWSRDNKAPNGLTYVLKVGPMLRSYDGLEEGFHYQNDIEGPFLKEVISILERHPL